MDTHLEGALRLLDQASGGNHRLRSCAARLLRDICAVASGLRPGFMLDYAVVRPAALSVLVAATLQELQAAAALCIAVVQECCLVVNMAALRQEPPLFVEFAAPNGDRGGMAAQWASQEQSTALWQRMQVVRDALASASAGVGASRAVPQVPLDELPHGLCMPTLNGYLLGYPVVYAVHDVDQAQAASRELSTSTLCLHTALATLGSPGTQLRRQGDGGGADDVLLGFTVPAALTDSGAWLAAKEQWQRGMQQRRRAAAGPYPWGPLRFEEASCMRGVAL